MKRTSYIDELTEEIDQAEEMFKNGELNLKSFDLHNELNSQFWNNGRLDSEVRVKLIEIAMDFFDSLGLADMTPQDDTNESIFNKYVTDVCMLGSLASYNYSSYADIDLHLVMNERAFIEDNCDGGEEFALNMLQKYFMKCKNAWNLLHGELKIHGYDVELYMQDVNEENATNGVYSLVNNIWVKKPQPMSDSNLDRDLVRRKVMGYIELIDDIESNVRTVQENSGLEALENKLQDVKTKIVKGTENRTGSWSGGDVQREHHIQNASQNRTHWKDKRPAV